MKKYILLAFVLGLFVGVGSSAMLLRSAMRNGGFFGSVQINKRVVTTKPLVLAQEGEICRLPIGTILEANSTDDITRLSLSIGIDNAFVSGNGGVFEVLPAGDARSSFSKMYPADE